MGVVQVETLDVDVTSDGQTHTLTNSVVLANAFVRNTNTRNASAGPIGNTGNAGPDDISAAAYLTGTDEVTFASNSITKKMICEVWRYTGTAAGPDEFVVRGRFSVTVAASSPSTTVATSGVVDRNRCVPFITGKVSTVTSTSEYNQFMAVAYLDASGDLVVERNNTDATALTVYVTLVEFTGGNWTVQHARGGFATAELTLRDDSEGSSGATTGVDWNAAFLADVQVSGDTGSNHAIEDLQVVASPGSDGNSVSVGKDSTAANDGAVMVHVLGHPSLAVARSSNFRSIPNNNTYVTETFPAITLSDLNEAALEWTVHSDGTGTAHARGSLSARLTATNTIQSWVHRSGNNGTYNYGVIDLSLVDGTVKPIIDTWPSVVVAGAVDLTLTGSLFGSAQGTGKLEIWSDTVGTVKTVQSIDSWSDTLVQFDLDVTGQTDGTRYFVLTDDLGAVSTPRAFQLGLESYNAVIAGLAPDHWWPLNNDSYVDVGTVGGSPMTNSIQGDGGSFEAVPICEHNTHSWLADGQVAREAPDNNEMNLQAELERTMGGWVRVNQVSQALTCIYKEGGGVNNICFFLGMGNIMVAQLADTDDDNVQVFSDFRAEPGRDYHIAFRFSYNEATPEFTFFVDGEQQAVSSGNPLTATDLDSHSGDIIFAGLDTAVEVAGTDVLFRNQESTNYAQWASWATALSKDEDIRDKLFRRGAVPTHTIASDTAVNMQTALDALASTAIANGPLSIRVQVPTDSSDLDLRADGVSFDPSTTAHVEWRGAGTLTWTNLNGSNAEVSKCFSLTGGVVAVVDPAVLTLTGLQDGSEVRVYEAGTGTELAGVESSTGGLFSSSIEVDSVDIVIHALGFLNQRLLAVDTSAGDVTLPIQQRTDRQYDNP